jgi:hypothetical protein
MTLKQFTWMEVGLGGSAFDFTPGAENYNIFINVDWPLRDTAQ